MSAVEMTPAGIARLFGVTSSDPVTVSTALDRAGSPAWERWERQVQGCGYCSRPVRLRGRVVRESEAGARHVYDTRTEPDGVLLVRCRNRRASVCPSCSHEYKGDMWHLLHAGVAGGSKGVPLEVAFRPMVFATLTAPSFGAVHSTRGDRAGTSARCHPRRRGAQEVCAHGRRTWCAKVHGEGDPLLGSPLCAECYDYEAAVWFNFFSSSELWRRFTIYVHRALASRLGLSERELRRLVRVQYAKVAEFQRRGVVHFHAVLRLDGPTHQDTGEVFAAPLLDVPVGALEAAVVDASRLVTFRVPAWRDDRPELVLRFGGQVDVSAVRHGSDLASGEVTPAKVAAYIAKYATKAAEDFGMGKRLASPEQLADLPVPVPDHVTRMVETAFALAAVQPRLGCWLHMLGFPGHFATKSRCFSTTLGALRQQRRDHQLEASMRGHHAGEEGSELDDRAGEETTLVVASWRYAGVGYRTSGDVALAAAAAARARERKDQARTALGARHSAAALPVAAGQEVGAEWVKGGAQRHHV